MRIKCPECESVLSLGQTKPGSYRPKCKQCGKSFRLKVSEDDPPKVAVGRVHVAAAKSEQPSHQPVKKASQPKSVQPRVDPSKVAATMDAGTQATMDSAAGVDATLDSADPQATQAAGVDATMDNSPSGAGVAVGASQAPIRGGAKTGSGAKRAEQTVAAGATLDAAVGGTVGGASQSAPSASVGKGKSIVTAGGSAAQSKVKEVARKPSSDGGEIPEKLGGYRILRLLGRGAMGAVYEAKQVSLDRMVALKTIRGRLCNNPATLARFTREAYAAAQLTHHNVVQIYDFGEDAGRHFFSMEWVRGGPLDELIRDKGALDPRLAAGYTLQAARGLQFAHRNGMVHRDVKPANLLLTDEGVVKVADLGLVKIPDQIDPESDVGALAISGGMESGTQVTMQGTAVGTPAYMAPEQGVDAAGVDHRADIYSLGCTLFYFLVGRPPFEGSVVSEVLEQHAKQPLPSLVEINARVPEALQQVVERAMAKRPEDRYSALSEMIHDLEAFLGVSTEGDFSPTSEQADKWERIALHYSASGSMSRLAKPVLSGLIGVSALVTIFMPLVAGLGWVLCGPALFVSAIVAALALGAGKSPLVTNFRAWIGSLSWIDCGIGAIGAIVLLLVALIAGMAPGLIVGGLLGAAAGAAYHFVIIAPARRKREPVIMDAERFVRDLRIDGADEDGLRSFAARYAGKQWQGIFEALFGYESLCAMREHLQADPSFPASTSGSWRDKICASLAAKSKANREAGDLKRLAKIEERGLQSEGVSAGDARDRAWQMAAAVMDNAKAVAPATAEVDAEAVAEERRQKMKAMLADARSGKYKKQRDPLAPLRFALGGQTRLLAGCILLVVFAIWGNSNGLFDSLKNLESLKDLDGVGTSLRENAASVNQAGTAMLLGANPWSVGIAGLLLSMSAFVSGWRMTPFAVLATIVILFGPSFGIPGFGDREDGSQLIAPWIVAGLAGVVVYLPGIIFGEAKEEYQ